MWFVCCALKGQKHFIHVILLPLQGELYAHFHTQGAALGYKLLAFQAVLSTSET